MTGTSTGHGFHGGSSQTSTEKRTDPNELATCPECGSGKIMNKVFVNIGLTLDGYMAPEGMTMNNPQYKGWGAKWGAMMGWIINQQYFRENLKLGRGQCHDLGVPGGLDYLGGRCLTQREVLEAARASWCVMSLSSATAGADMTIALTNQLALIPQIRVHTYGGLSEHTSELFVRPRVVLRWQF